MEMMYDTVIDREANWMISTDGDDVLHYYRSRHYQVNRYKQMWNWMFGT